MKNKLLLALVLLANLSSNAQINSYFLSQPNLTPDGIYVVFCYDGDIWKANTNDGIATRLTAMKGYETSPKISPDGNWIAFTGRQFGNSDVYVMPLNGGDIKRLTWFSGSDEVSSWSWDSKSIYFTSTRKSRLSTYKVGINGGTATPVFNSHFFLNDHNVVEHPTSGELFFNDTWESSIQLHRKRYKGPYNPDIQSYNPKTQAYTQYTTWVGKDFGATIDKKGNIYYISDSLNGEYNLFAIKGGKHIPVTSFHSSIKNAMVCANGSKVVFEKDYHLCTYNTETNISADLNIIITRNNTLPEASEFNVRGKISNFDVSGDGKKLAFISRGQLFVSDVEGKFIEPIDKESMERKGEVKWLADNKTLLYSQTENGYTNWFTIAADKTGEAKQLTHDTKNNHLLSLNKKRTMGVYFSGREDICTIDLKTFNCKVVTHNAVWGINNDVPDFSPDGEWIIYTAHRNFEQDVFIYNLKSKQTINLTKTAISEVAPMFSPDGRDVYFTSGRLAPAFPTDFVQQHVYRLPLQKFDSFYYADKYSELFNEAKKDTNEVVNITKVDTNRIMDRMELVGPSFGVQNICAVFEKEGTTIVLYTSTQLEGKTCLYKTEYKPFEPTKTEKISGAEGTSIGVIESKDKYYALIDGTLHKLSLGDANKAEPINISYTFRKNLAGEFDQIFDETWAQVEENYYDDKFHGIDWKAIKATYKKYLPYLNNRNDLRVLLNDMLGELNSSHQGFYSSGDEERVMNTEATMETGIVFDDANPLKVKSILNGTPADKVNIDIKPGDILKKVNDKEVDPAIDRYFYFTNPSADKEVSLTFDRKGKSVTAIIHPQPSLYMDYYEKWIDNNEALVNEKSNNRIAYACMKNMGQSEYDKFYIKMTQTLQEKEALILDLRYNTGGNVHDQVLQFLSQRSYLKWKYRGEGYTTQPNFAPSDKPVVLLINEQSLSDAEMTAQGFKALKLGTIIGNETYHWIIFTSEGSLVDGSAVRLPAWGCYSLDGQDLELTGVAPDIKVINTFRDKLNNKDPQLETAIKEIMMKLGK